MTGLNDPPAANPAVEEDYEAYEDAFLEKVKSEYKDGWTEANWEEVCSVISFQHLNPLIE